ncbi:acyltransferase [Anoxynatronum buryatiense]|uniref:Chloramphenicol acetyltransferase n=1 Tax=Anoxynatronum buryatiense TaxID=489973 RepID=A0AA45WW19_9CLOT|nr:acyltransferase [Anoxynatronum buryatiense]SMP56925.1 galactoside O-acetyltransferase [Anoxynatronum buryatiense]
MLQSKYLTEYDMADFGFKSIGKNVRISSDARIYGQENISIGNNVRIDDFVILSAVNGSITIGNYVFIARSSHLSGALGIELKDFSSMAANTVIYSASDDYSGSYLTAQAVPQKYTNYRGGKVVLGRHVIIGSSTTIIGPCDIGEGCSVGAMTLVNKKLEPWGVYAGVPAKRLKDRNKKMLELELELLADDNSNHNGI